MENKNNLKIGMALVVCLIVGAIMGRASPISNSSKNDNSSKVFVTQGVPENSKNLENFKKNSKNLEKNENFSKKVNINTATLGEFIDARVGIGKTKYKKLVDNRPYKNTRELLDKGVIGYYAYNRHKDRFVVGD